MTEPMQIGRIDLGPVEPRRLTQTEQRVMDAALRRSVTILFDPEVERLKAEVSRLRSQCLRYEGYIENLEKKIAQAKAALGMANVQDI